MNRHNQYLPAWLTRSMGTLCKELSSSLCLSTPAPHQTCCHLFHADLSAHLISGLICPLFGLHDVDADTWCNLQDSRTAVKRHTVFPDADAVHGCVNSFDARSGSSATLQLYTCAAYSTLIAASKSQNGSSTGRISAPAFCKTRRGDSHFSACHCSNLSLACKVTTLPSTI